MEQKGFIPKFIEAMNHRLQQEQKLLSDEAAKLLSQLGTWDKRMETKEWDIKKLRFSYKRLNRDVDGSKERNCTRAQKTP